MGNTYLKQGECVECGRITHDYCDHCGVFVCEDHRVVKPAVSGLKKNFFCKKCGTANRKIKKVNPDMRHL